MWMLVNFSFTSWAAVVAYFGLCWSWLFFFFSLVPVSLCLSFCTSPWCSDVQLLVQSLSAHSPLRAGSVSLIL